MNIVVRSLVLVEGEFCRRVGVVWVLPNPAVAVVVEDFLWMLVEPLLYLRLANSSNPWYTEELVG